MVKKLFIKSALFFFICLGIVTAVLIQYGGSIDFFYEKFTVPKTKSMIIGDSRSFQGIQPVVINDYLGSEGYDLPVLNYSFTIAQAIFGPLYNTSIFKKLDATASNGIFIISVTPEMLTEHQGYDNTLGIFREEGQPPHNMRFVTMNPNYEYLIKNLSFFHFKGVFRQKAKLHKDGWLEETNLPSNDTIFEAWKQNQINLFLKEAEKAKLSKVRIKSLVDLITTLDTHGDVFLVRMPISKDFLAIEERYFPSFGQVVDSVANQQKVSFFDFNRSTTIYKTYDGHHFDKFVGKQFTKALCDSILNGKHRDRILKNSIQ